MSFRILKHAKDYFSNWPTKEGPLWDQYYVCFMLGIVGNKRGEVNQSNSDEFLRYIIPAYIGSKSAFLGLLTYAHLRQLGHKIVDRELVRDSIDKIIDPNSQNSFSDYAINLMNEFAAGGFHVLKENIPDKPVSEQSYFLLDWHRLLKKLIDENSEWNLDLEGFTKPPKILTGTRTAEEQVFIDLLSKDETDTFEVKGSVYTPLAPYFKSGESIKSADIPKQVLKTIVGFLNTRVEGKLIVGAVEPDRFKSLQDDPEIQSFGEYLITGVELETVSHFHSSLDNYVSSITTLIKNQIGNDAAHLTKIKAIELGGKTILGISVLKSKSGGWFYLNETDFYVRLHNRTESLNGPDADKYKLENQ